MLDLRTFLLGIASKQLEIPMKRFFLLMVFLGFALASAAQAAVIYLKDGSQVRGTVVSATARDIQLHTPDGVQTISTDRILRVDYSESGSSVAPEQVATPEPVPSEPEPPRVWRSPYRAPTEEFNRSFSLDYSAIRTDES